MYLYVCLSHASVFVPSRDKGFDVLTRTLRKEGGPKTRQDVLSSRTLSTWGPGCGQSSLVPQSSPPGLLLGDVVNEESKQGVCEWSNELRQGDNCCSVRTFVTTMQNTMPGLVEQDPPGSRRQADLWPPLSWNSLVGVTPASTSKILTHAQDQCAPHCAADFGHSSKNQDRARCGDTPVTPAF